MTEPARTTDRPSQMPAARRAAAPAPAAFEALFERHFELVYRVARRLASSDAGTDALVTRAFAEAHRHALGARDRATAEAFLMAALWRGMHAEAGRCAERTGPEASDAARLRAALSGLDPAERFMLVLVELEGWQPARAGHVLGLAAARASALLSRARRSFECELAQLSQPPVRPTA